MKLASGNIAIIFNNISSPDDNPAKSVWLPQRYPVTIALSEDGGNTWPYMRHVDTSDDFCGPKNKQLNRRCEYPCILGTQDGILHVAYAYRDRQCIKYVRVSEDWVSHGFFEADDLAYFTQLFG